MADEPLNPTTTVESFEPEVLPPRADEFAADSELVVEEEAPPPLGRSWAFNFVGPSPGVVVIRGHGPVEVRGMEQLRVWIEKCLRTPRGSSPIYSFNYGVEDLTEYLGRPAALIPMGEIRMRVTEALTFHPRITDVTGFSWEFDDEGETLYVTFTVIVDDEDERVRIVYDDFPVLTAGVG